VNVRYAFLVCALAVGCRSTPTLSVPLLSHASMAEDFNTYELERVGLMPTLGRTVDPSSATALEQGLLAEVSRGTPLELVPLTAHDLEEIRGSDPHRRGRYDVRTILEVSRRYRLDAVMFATILQQKQYPPMMLGVQVDVVAAETGLVIWSGTVHLDANDFEVQRGLEAYFGRENGEEAKANNWDLALLSPTRFAHFAAYQIARVL